MIEVLECMLFAAICADDTLLRCVAQSDEACEQWNAAFGYAWVYMRR